jgi:hypothetical protein
VRGSLLLQAYFFGARQRVNHVTSRTDAQYYRITCALQQLPPDVPPEYPANLILSAIDNSPKPRYPSVMKRSGYMAEFARCYHRTINKDIITGQCHLQEVAYFLASPIKDEVVIRQAQEQASFAESDPTIDDFCVRRALISASSFLGTAVGFFGTLSLEGCAIYKAASALLK